MNGSGVAPQHHPARFLTRPRSARPKP